MKTANIYAIYKQTKIYVSLLQTSVLNNKIESKSESVQNWLNWNQ